MLAQAGHAEAYGELVRTHQPAALRVATAVLGTFDGADDVVQEAFERAWRSLGRFDLGREFRPWFLRIVANLARNDLRSRARRAKVVQRAASADHERGTTVATPEELIVDEDERREVAEALSCLDPDDRLIIALRHFEQLSEREMSEVLACPAGTVKSRLSRAMARLRHQFVVWIVVLLVVLGLVATPVREAVAGWLGIGSTRIENVPSVDLDLQGLRPLAYWLEPIERAEAEAVLGRKLPVVGGNALGRADVATLPGTMPDDTDVIMVWDDGETTLWLRPLDSGSESSMFTKSVPPVDEPGLDPSSVETVDGLGDEALLVHGAHVLNASGRRIAASTTLIWLEDEWEYRLESDQPPETMLEIAHSLRWPSRR